MIRIHVIVMANVSAIMVNAHAKRTVSRIAPVQMSHAHVKKTNATAMSRMKALKKMIRGSP
ncbi:hypothetical protein A2957_02770 [Candidatus Roizmanbacteria bacterium RIFCSPLOWO2_01_FULL_38_11]|uniref:Uncharacterized protein n=1 Tax=Candidatus Roizmanbacteria bacterium RIFCSPLOWO2_01_FULL_38_11 TaxID=1802060 RepID=A0A1F7IKT9_9BACT|nr:MAG: hypothetical protein A2957_02770 [Candidatus Roizmanbacteria bacterium RIFCSPLOWO2_01_FULL_38_11]